MGGFSRRMSNNAASDDANKESDLPEDGSMRIVLLGRTGTGRSSSGNTILSRPAFRIKVSPRSTTSHCENETGDVAGRAVSITDTPGFLHTHLSAEEVTAELGRIVSLCSPGPHTFLVTLPIGRFTQQEMGVLELIKSRFGPEVLRFTMVLFTWGDQLRGKSIEEFLEESPHLSEFVNCCHGGCHVFDNTVQSEEGDTSPQVKQLLMRLDEVAEKNEGYYTIKMLREAESALNEAREKEEEMEKKRKEQTKAKKTEERQFWTELLKGAGKGAAEGAGFTGIDNKVKAGKVVKKTAAMAVMSPRSGIKTAVKVVGGAVREGSKVIAKHKKLNDKESSENPEE